mmetsp:Transcript_47562/g.53204  ORF Transcript_47562/g.53204 Transcript_47562/m.53204 type:complete len:97 (-) Transcript_47562:455-745(-)
MFPLIRIELLPDCAHCSFYLSSSSPAMIRNCCPPGPKHRKENMFPLIQIELLPDSDYCSLYMSSSSPPTIQNDRCSPDPKHQTRKVLVLGMDVLMI